MTTKIVTWNINSIRIRIPLLKRLVEQHNPDIICLQETKVEDGSFPVEDVKSLGYPHLYFSGQKSYNGVAILSKIPLTKMHAMELAQSDHKRHISALLPDGTQLHNFYVPAGGDIPDRVENPAYDFKLRFVENMTEWSKSTKKNDKIIILGDFNIAPGEHDVWSHKQLLKIVSHTPVEVDALLGWQRTGFVDAVRHFVPADEKLYSWWSYRNKDWRASDRGRRLDHVWVSPDLVPALKTQRIHRDARDWPQSSDHVPVAVDFAI